MEVENRTEAQKQRKNLIAETRALLQSEHSNTLRSALDTVRSEGLEELLPETLALLATTDLELRSYIFEFLIDIHSSALVTHLANALEKAYDADHDKPRNCLRPRLTYTVGIRTQSAETDAKRGETARGSSSPRRTSIYL